MKPQNFEIDFEGKKLKVNLGELAQQAGGSCRVQYGNTTVLVAATMNKKPKDAGYFPLVVDYEEKFYAAGKIKGSRFIKREGRPSEDAILTARLIDRALRPRFDQRIRNEVQVVVMVLSFDGQNDPDIPAMFGASLALMISDAPFNGPVSGVRIGKNEGKLITNPTYEERATGDFDAIVAGTDGRINMLEVGANIVTEEQILEGITFGFENLKKLNKFQSEIAKKVAKPKINLELHETDPEVKKKILSFLSGKVETAMYVKDKQERMTSLGNLEESLIEYMKSQDLDEHIGDAVHILSEESDIMLHKNILDKDKRPDGRKTDELRDISVSVGGIPQIHGMGLFNRGETQVMSVLTLAAPSAAQLIDTMEVDEKRRFMHHYTFPPFSVGETGRMGGAGRREIGHGALAERALAPLIPNKDDFPYTIRLVSETLSSNGSSSMASACGSSLALMDGGVPIKEHVAGIAMGLIMNEDGSKYKVLTDIQGPEDHHGDMDFKVAGTKDGVTAIQMDVKIEGITAEVLKDGLAQAKKARLEILEKMNEVIKKPRAQLSEYAPQITTLKIDPEKIGVVIGPSGKMINKIIDENNVEIDIDDDGSVFITGVAKEGVDNAIKIIQNLTKVVKEGEEYEGKVVNIKDFGAFVELLPGQDGLLHVSEISQARVENPSDVLKLGQIVKVKVKKIDEYGKISLTMKF